MKWELLAQIGLLGNFCTYAENIFHLLVVVVHDLADMFHVVLIRKYSACNIRLRRFVVQLGEASLISLIFFFRNTKQVADEIVVLLKLIFLAACTE